MCLHLHYSVWTNVLPRKGSGVSPKNCSLLPLYSVVQQVLSSECTSFTIRPCIRVSSTAYRSYLSLILLLQFGIVFLPSNCYNICIRSLFLHSLKKNVCPYFDLSKIKSLTSLKKTPISSDRCLLIYKYPGEKTHGFNRGMIVRISLNISVFSFDCVAVCLACVYRV